MKGKYYESLYTAVIYCQCIVIHKVPGPNKCTNPSCVADSGHYTIEKGLAQDYVLHVVVYISTQLLKDPLLKIMGC